MKKKPTTVRLHIPEPCHQDFSKMHPLPGGRFCGQCEKTVVDFRGMSDGQIAHIYKKRQGRVCGIFYGDQLNRELIVPHISAQKNNWKAMAAVAASLFFGNMVEGQNTIPTENISIEKTKDTPTKADGKQTISGKVMDGKGEPLMYAAVVLSGTHFGAYTNENGGFILEIPADIYEHEIEVSFMGYETAMMLWDKKTQNENGMEIQLKEGLKLPIVELTARNSSHEQGLITGAFSISQKDHREEMQKEKSEIKNTEIDLSIFPNPFTSHISLKINPVKRDAFLFHLYSESGQLIFAETRELNMGEQTLQFNFGQKHLPEGIYFFRISDSIGEVRTKRIVKVNP